MKIRPQLYNLRVAIICAIGIVVAYYAFSPGFMSSDSIDQYRQALTGNYKDWHPIIMALLWSLILKLQNGPELMLLLQLTMFFTALYLLAISMRGVVGYVIVLVVPLTPFVCNFLGYIIKDTQMATSGLLAYAILFHHIVSGKRIKAVVVIISYVLVTYCVLLRFDAIFAFIPFFALLYYTINNKASWKKISIVTLALSLSILIVGKSLSIIISPQKTHPVQKLMMHDLAGIYVQTDQQVFPDKLFVDIPGFDTVYLKEKYHPATYDILWWNDDDKQMDISDTLELYNEIRSAWVSAVAIYPIEYLRHRSEGFLYHLRIKKRDTYFSYYHPWIDKNEFGFELKQTIPYRWYSIVMNEFKGSMLMLPWFWLLVNFLLLLSLVFVQNNKYKYLSLVLLISSMLYRIPQFFIFQTDTDFRYFYWTCMACTISLFIIFKGITVSRAEPK